MYNVPPDGKGPREKFQQRIVVAAVVVMVVVCVLLFSLYVYLYV